MNHRTPDDKGWLEEYERTICEEGYYETDPDIVDAKEVQQSSCPDCSRRRLTCRAFRTHRPRGLLLRRTGSTYRAYQVCSWCGYWEQI